MIRRARLKAAGEREKRYEGERESRSGRPAEINRDEAGAAEYEQHLQERIGVKGAVFDRERERATGHSMIEVRETCQPPAIGCSVGGIAADGKIIGVDVMWG